MLGPIAGGILDAVNNPTAETPANMQVIRNASTTNGYKVHRCFSNNLPASDLG